MSKTTKNTSVKNKTVNKVEEVVVPYRVDVKGSARAIQHNNPINVGNYASHAGQYTMQNADKWMKGFTALADYPASKYFGIEESIHTLVRLQATNKARAGFAENMLFNIYRNFWQQQTEPTLPFYTKVTGTTKGFSGNLEYYENTKYSYETQLAKVNKLRAEIAEDETEITESVDYNGKVTVETESQHPNIAILPREIQILAQVKQSFLIASHTMKTNRIIMHTLMDLYKYYTAEWIFVPESNALTGEVDASGKGKWEIKTDKDNKPMYGKEYVHPFMQKELDRIAEHKASSSHTSIAEASLESMDAMLAEINNTPLRVQAAECQLGVNQ